MSYTVMIMPSAERELEEAYNWLAAQTAEHAPRWYNGILDALHSLKEMPARHPLSPKRAKGDNHTRQLVYGDRQHAYVILYSIRGERVIVTHIRHAARGE